MFLSLIICFTSIKLKLTENILIRSSSQCEGLQIIMPIEEWLHPSALATWQLCISLPWPQRQVSISVRPKSWWKTCDPTNLWQDRYPLVSFYCPFPICLSVLGRCPILLDASMSWYRIDSPTTGRPTACDISHLAPPGWCHPVEFGRFTPC